MAGEAGTQSSEGPQHGNRKLLAAVVVVVIIVLAALGTWYFAIGPMSKQNCLTITGGSSALACETSALNTGPQPVNLVGYQHATIGGGATVVPNGLTIDLANPGHTSLVLSKVFFDGKELSNTWVYNYNNVPPPGAWEAPYSNSIAPGTTTIYDIFVLSPIVGQHVITVVLQGGQSANFTISV